jgi:hypothetical protein
MKRQFNEAIAGHEITRPRNNSTRQFRGRSYQNNKFEASYQGHLGHRNGTQHETARFTENIVN